MAEEQIPQAPADAAPRRARRNAASEADELAGTGYEHLPEAFQIRGPDGFVETRDPCYRLDAPIFTGEGRYARTYDAGTVLAYFETPNDAMTPLNRAAGLAMVRWRRSLPLGGFAPIGIEDMCEAAQELAGDPACKALPRVEFNKMVMDRAIELKMQREGRDFRMPPPLSPHNFRAAATGAPPLFGAQMHSQSSMSGFSRLGPGPDAPPPDPRATRQVDPAQGRTP